MKFISFALTLLLSQADAKLGGGGDDNHDIVDGVVEHLDLEVVVESGERQLFPLLPGTKCPAGHTCRVRTTSGGWAPEKLSPMGSSLKDSLKTPLAMAMNWDEFNNNMNTVVVSNDYCTRRAAMTRAAGLAAGVAAATVAQPAYAAATTKVKMGDDSGLLTFVPKKINICAGDSIEWSCNKGCPHNAVFDEDAVPEGVDAEEISKYEQLGTEGDKYSVKLTVAGTYGYYCEPHRGAGMEATVVVA